MKSDGEEGELFHDADMSGWDPDLERIVFKFEQAVNMNCIEMHNQTETIHFQISNVKP